jgi:hypothetical protein
MRFPSLRVLFDLAPDDWPADADVVTPSAPGNRRCDGVPLMLPMWPATSIPVTPILSSAGGDQQVVVMVEAPPKTRCLLAKS